LLARLVLAGGAVLATVTLLELLSLAGFVDYRSVFKTRYAASWQSPYDRFDAELLHVHRPNVRVVGSVGGGIARSWNLPPTSTYSYDMTYDRNGFLNDADFDRAEVAVIGDSFLEVAAAG